MKAEYKPKPKVAAAAIAGLIVSVVFFLADLFEFEINAGPEQLTALVTTVVIVVTAYMKKD